MPVSLPARRLRARMLFSSALIAPLAALAAPAAAQTLPSGGTVVSGTAAIDGSGPQTTITQSTPTAIINWNSFSIGEGGTVQFDNGAGATLNRVLGGNVSQIDGQLSATGSVYLINPNGIIIGEDGEVDVGGTFVGSTLDATDADFLDGGDLSMSGSSASTAMIVNLGSIGALGGDVVLAAYRVRNEGTISAPGGTAGLLSGYDILLADTADNEGKFKVLVGRSTGYARNIGTIEAAAAELRANGGSVYALAGSTRGVITATGVSTLDGRIFLTAGAGGSIEVDESDISAGSADGSGGAILIGSADADEVAIGAGALLDAAADSGAGGSILTEAAMVTVADGASSTTAGAGGADGSWTIRTEAARIGAGGTISGGSLAQQLSGGDVVIEATGTPGDVVVDDMVFWMADTELTLSAARDVLINRDLIAMGGAAGLVLNHGSGRDYVLNGGRVNLSGASATLSIDGDAYTLIHNVTQLQSMSANLTGLYALGNDVDASATTSWNSGDGFVPVGTGVTAFTGTLAGLGHVVTGLHINRPAQDYIGLIGNLGASGVVREIGVAAGTVTGRDYTGGLVGQSSGSIVYAYSDNDVNGFWGTGGLVGQNAGTMFNVYAGGAVAGSNSNTGGLAGINNGLVSIAYATGTVAGTANTGGLVGNQGATGTVSNAYATGSVDGTASVGGLFGAASGAVSHAYASGAVSGTSNVGGLIGNAGGTLTATNLYWDAYSSGLINSQGNGSTFAATMVTSDPEASGDANYAYDPSAYTGLDDALWAPAGDGYRPELWGISHVIGVFPVSASRVYGDENPDLAEGATFRGVGYWHRFNGFIATDATAESDVGTYAIIVSGGIHGGGGVRVISGQGVLTVDPRPLTVTADDLSRVYGDANPTLTYDWDGLVNGDTLEGELTTSAGLTSNVGGYAITQGSLTASDNYILTFNDGTLDVTPRPIIVTANDLSRLYGIGNPTLTYSVDDLLEGDSLTGTLATAATALSNVGDYDITQGSLTASTNYDLTFVDGTLEITPRSLIVTADDLSRAYGDDNPALTYVLTGDGLGEGDMLAGDLATAATVTSNVGDYAITQGSLEAPSTNYVLTYVAGTLAVTPRAVFVTADDLSRVYGNANPALTYSADGLINGDTLTGTLATSAGITSNVGDYAITLGSISASSNYVVTVTGGTLTVTPRALNVAANDLSRIYGAANPALTYQATGLVNGDMLTGMLATSATTASNVGSYGITQGSLASSANYILTFTAGTLGVTPRAITVSADDLERLYGNANPALTYTVGGQGLVNGDSLTGALATSAGLESNVGSYGITQGSLAASSNYVLSFEGGELRITPRSLIATADNLSRVYGDANPALTYVLGGDGLVGNDRVTGALATSAAVTSNVGDYGITRGTLAAPSANYILTYVDGTLSVTPRPVSVTADDLSRVYGDANPALTYSADGLINGDTLTGTLATSAGITSNVGDYAITLGSISASSNYVVTVTGGTLTITPRALLVTADDLSRLYGDANPALTYEVAGLVNGDSLTGDLATSATVTSNVGSYGITQGSLASSANYVLTFADGTLAVTPRPITIAADSFSRLYGDPNPPLTYAVGGSGLVNGDALTGNLFTSANVLSHVGSYAITQGSVAASSNYAVTFINGALVVTPRPLAVTADDLSRIYGDANPPLTYQATGLVNGDMLTGVLTTPATATSNVGTYAITQGSLAASSDYVLAFADGRLVITARSITIAADSFSRMEGEANPPLTYRVGGLGLVNGDSLTGSLATTAGPETASGNYEIGQGTLAASSNYVVTGFTPGVLEVTAPPPPPDKPVEDVAMVFVPAAPARTVDDVPPEPLTSCADGGDGCVLPYPTNQITAPGIRILPSGAR